MKGKYTNFLAYSFTIYSALHLCTKMQESISFYFLCSWRKLYKMCWEELLHDNSRHNPHISLSFTNNGKKKSDIFWRSYAYNLSVLQFNTNILITFDITHQMWYAMPFNIYQSSLKHMHRWIYGLLIRRHHVLKLSILTG